ncbi:MAG: HAD family hydrolase [Calditrichaeota bacterium]|nr:MAG: HAD family hydrolase [Calditrichota bacterium]
MSQSYTPVLLLFDIDGTLILTGGKGRKAMVRAIEEEFHCSIESEFSDFAGSTDQQIIHTLLRKNQITTSPTPETLNRIIERYLFYLESYLSEEDSVEVLPGIKELLQATSNNSQFFIGLVTGNLEPGARIKLTPPNLNHYFPIGAFGSDSLNRDHLPPLARQRASEHYRTTFHPENIWIIGDTPKDIQCSKVNHFKSLAVATGGWSVRELSQYQPDLVFDNLKNTKRVLTAILEHNHQRTADN